jgi:hypothetical protein
MGPDKNLADAPTESLQRQQQSRADLSLLRPGETPLSKS